MPPTLTRTCSSIEPASLTIAAVWIDQLGALQGGSESRPRSVTSAIRASAPAASIRSADSGLESIPITSAPASRSFPATAPPMNPPAPVTATRLFPISIASVPAIAVEPILAAAMRRSRSRPSPALRATVRAGACACVAAAVAVPLLRRRLRIPAPLTVAACVSGPLALAVLRPRSKRRDVALFVLQMWAFTVVHEMPYDDPEALRARLRIRYPIRGRPPARRRPAAQRAPPADAAPPGPGWEPSTARSPGSTGCGSSSPTSPCC